MATGDMGARGLSWADLHAWRAMTGTLISAREARLLKRLSAVYANALHTSTNPDQPAYWMGTDLLAARQRSMANAEQGLASVFGAMAKKGAK